MVALGVAGFGHGSSKYIEFVYFWLLYLILKHLLGLVQCFRPHCPCASSCCRILLFLSMMRAACSVVGLNAASDSWKALLYIISLTLWVSVSSGSALSSSVSAVGSWLVLASDSNCRCRCTSAMSLIAPTASLSC